MEDEQTRRTMEDKWREIIKNPDEEAKEPVITEETTTVDSEAEPPRVPDPQAVILSEIIDLLSYKGKPLARISRKKVLRVSMQLIQYVRLLEQNLRAHQVKQLETDLTK